MMMVERLLIISCVLGSGIGAAICAITANDARQALQKGEIQQSAFYQQTKKPT